MLKKITFSFLLLCISMPSLAMFKYRDMHSAAMCAQTTIDNMRAEFEERKDLGETLYLNTSSLSGLYALFVQNRLLVQDRKNLMENKTGSDCDVKKITREILQSFSSYKDREKIGLSDLSSLIFPDQEKSAAMTVVVVLLMHYLKNMTSYYECDGSVLNAETGKGKKDEIAKVVIRDLEDLKKGLEAEFGQGLMNRLQGVFPDGISVGGVSSALCPRIYTIGTIKLVFCDPCNSTAREYLCGDLWAYLRESEGDRGSKLTNLVERALCTGMIKESADWLKIISQLAPLLKKNKLSENVLNAQDKLTIPINKDDKAFGQVGQAIFESAVANLGSVPTEYEGCTEVFTPDEQRRIIAVLFIQSIYQAATQSKDQSCFRNIIQYVRNHFEGDLGRLYCCTGVNLTVFDDSIYLDRAANLFAEIVSLNDLQTASTLFGLTKESKKALDSLIQNSDNTLPVIEEVLHKSLSGLKPKERVRVIAAALRIVDISVDNDVENQLLIK